MLATKRFLACFILLFIGMASTAVYAAKPKDRAISVCKHKISNAYGVDNFRNVFAEKDGHHKWQVYGQVKYHKHRYPFQCKVKNDTVRSYSYSGPHNKHDKHKDHSSDAAAIAVGVGLAAVAAAIMSSSDEAGKDKTYTDGVSKEQLEDECHDALNRRVMSDQYTARRVRFDYDSISHDRRRLDGEGQIRWDEGNPSEIKYACWFDNSGRVIDSSYSYY